METKLFKTEDVMSTITGRLMGDISGVYQVLSWMTGEDVFTHQLPRISREAVPVIVAMHPHLQQAIHQAEQVNPENYRTWRQMWQDRYGIEIAVPRFSLEQHERIDPESELIERIHPDKVVVIQKRS